MPPPSQKADAARAFIRSLNVLVKLVRLYGAAHTQAAAQLQSTWDDLRAAIGTDSDGLMLGVADGRLLVNGEPLEAFAVGRSFAQLLAGCGLSSIEFLPAATEDDLARFVRVFSTARAASLADELQSALADSRGIRVNPVRFVAEGSATAEARLAAALTASSLGEGAQTLKQWLADPQKLLQLIAAAEGSRQGGAGGAATAPGEDLPVAGPGAAAGVSAAPPGSAAPGAGDEEILRLLRVLSRFGPSALEEGERTPEALQTELAGLPARARNLLERALATLAAQGVPAQADEPMLLRLAEHLAIRFALDAWERGEVRVSAVRQMLDRLSEEIRSLRTVVSAREKAMAQAGIAVESHADLLDRQFWAAVPESGKRAVLASPDAWCVPARNVRQFVEELARKGDRTTAGAVLSYYAAALTSEDTEARRRSSSGLAELAELYAGAAPGLLEAAIRSAGMQLAAERDEEVQERIGAAFVRLAQQAGARRRYRAVEQVLDSLDGIECQRPTFAQDLRPRIGLEKQIPEFVEDALRQVPDYADGLLAVLERLPAPVADALVPRFNRGTNRGECDRVAEVAGAVGASVAACLRDRLQTAQPAEAAEVVGLLSRLDPPAVAQWLPARLQGWPRAAQDRALRLLAASGSPERGRLLLAAFDQFDHLLQPLALDEISMSGEAAATDRLLRLASGELTPGAGDFLRLKAVEALGRLRAASAVNVLREIVEAKKLWRWLHHGELRLAAFQALRSVAPDWARGFTPHSGFTAEELDELSPRDPAPASPWFRQRRYARMRLRTTLPAVATSDRETVALELRSLSLSGGLGSGDRHIAPGTLVTLRIGSSLRPIRAQALMRGSRAQALSFEFVDMDLEDRARLRRLLRECATAAAPGEEQGRSRAGMMPAVPAKP